jgi:hypothetical protein
MLPWRESYFSTRQTYFTRLAHKAPSLRLVWTHTFSAVVKYRLPIIFVSLWPSRNSAEFQTTVKLRQLCRRGHEVSNLRCKGLNPVMKRKVLDKGIIVWAKDSTLNGKLTSIVRDESLIYPLKNWVARFVTINFGVYSTIIWTWSLKEEKKQKRNKWRTLGGKSNSEEIGEKEERTKKQVKLETKHKGQDCKGDTRSVNRNDNKFAPNHHVRQRTTTNINHRRERINPTGEGREGYGSREALQRTNDFGILIASFLVGFFVLYWGWNATKRRRSESTVTSELFP